MASIFSGLPNSLIIDIIRIDNYRKKYDKVVAQIDFITTYDERCWSIREVMNYGEVYDIESKSVSEIWDWHWYKSENDISWLNEIWWNEEKKIIQRLRNDREKREKERMKYGEVILELNELSPLTYCCSSDKHMRRQVFKTLYDKLGWERPEWFPKLVYRYVMY
tara:strand:- start:15 stop:506 length:492 start_codon:yes stop_codon:yes gene_type:complete